VSGRWALALRRFKEEPVLSHVVRSPPTLEGLLKVEELKDSPGLDGEPLALNAYRPTRP
jgi:hypothetical protein